jgi:hypothetical protein
MLQCISHLNIAVLHLQGDGVGGWLGWCDGWHHETSDNTNIFQASQKHQAKHTDLKQYLTPILLLHANIDAIKKFRGLETLEVGCGRCSSRCCKAVVMSMRKPLMVSDKYDH